MTPDSEAGAGNAGAGTGALKVVLLHQHRATDEDHVAAALQEGLSAAGYDVFVDRMVEKTIKWAQILQEKIEHADAVIPLVSRESMHDEVLAFEVEVAREASVKRRGRPMLLPVRVGYGGPLPEALGAMLNNLEYQMWEGPEGNEGLKTEILEMLKHMPENVPPPVKKVYGNTRRDEMGSGDPVSIEPAGGAVPLHSKFYVARESDQELHQALERYDSIILIKGARQMGKTSLLARGLQGVRTRGARVAMTDFQEFGSANLANTTTLYLSLAESLVDRLGLEASPSELWDARRSANVNFDRFLRREVLAKIDGPLVWGLDEVDRLLTTEYASEVFGLFRSWHNQRATDPTGPWQGLTLVIAYATEAYLFIRDPNQSPFNVGTRLVLEDFSQVQVQELNCRYGSPLRDQGELARFFKLVAGHPFLVRRGLQEMVTRKMRVDVFEAKASEDEGLFSDHLRRIIMLMARDQELMEVVRESLRGGVVNNAEAFHRLRSAGVMAGTSPADMKPRCEIYATYLRRHLI